MPRILYDHLLTEVGLDLLTEAGDALVLREIGMAGDLAVSGGSPGTVGGTGRVIAAGTGEVSGQPGSVAGTGRVVLHGVGTVAGGIYPTLLTESGLDLLTESGEPLSLGWRNGGEVSASGRVGGAAALVGIGEVSGQPGSVAGTGTVILRGVCTAAGQPGTVGGTGRIIGVAPPVTAPTAVHFITAPATLHGRCTAHGQPGTATGTGRLTLVGKGSVTGQPGTATGTGHLTLTGHATITAPPARLSGRGDVIDELALILALAA
jgi:hypothetical protein